MFILIALFSHFEEDVHKKNWLWYSTVNFSQEKVNMQIDSLKKRKKPFWTCMVKKQKGAIFNKLHTIHPQTPCWINCLSLNHKCHLMSVSWEVYHCMVQLGVSMTETELEKICRMSESLRSRKDSFCSSRLNWSHQKCFWRDLLMLIAGSKVTCGSCFSRTSEDDRNGNGWADKALEMRLLSVYQK